MENQYKPIVEALLFIATEPLLPEEVERVLGLSKKTVVDVIEELAREYEETDRGFQIRKMGKGYAICTRPEYAEYIRELFQPKVQQRLTQAALETLAIIAYKQPITRGEIEDIRGVKVEKALITLQKRGLIQEMGRKHTIGTPIIYGTTDEFLQYFGLSDLTDLPAPADFKLLEKKMNPDGIEEEELYEGMEEEFEQAMDELREDLPAKPEQPRHAGGETRHEVRPAAAAKREAPVKTKPKRAEVEENSEYQPIPLLNFSDD